MVTYFKDSYETSIYDAASAELGYGEGTEYS
jgi:hypothetical protein